MGPYTMHTRTVTLATFHLLRISHIQNSVWVTFYLFRIFHIRRLTSDGRGGRFNFPGQTYPEYLMCDVGESLDLDAQLNQPMGSEQGRAP